jgi:hypothetical protein
MGGCQNGTCGKLGQACCGGGVGCTEAFTECRQNVCAACGDVGQRCCPHETCKVGTCKGNEICQ